MAESGGGGLGARFFSGLGALGNILRLSTGSQAVPAEGTIDDDDDELVSVDEEVAITKEILQQNDEIAPVNVDSVLSATQLTEEEYESVEYEGQLVTEMKNYELRSALKQEGVKVDARQTKKQCMDVLIKIAFTKVKNGTKSAAIENSENSSRALRSTPAKQLSKAAAGSSVSVNKMSTRRSAAASGPPSSNLRHRSPPHAPAATSPIVEKRKRATRTPSAKVEVNVASGKSDKRKSHISNDEYELSGTARKKLAVSAPTSAKKKSTPRTKQPPAEKKILPVSAKKPSPIRTSAVGLDEIAVNNAYGKSSRNREDSEEEEEEEEESMSDMEEADSVPGVHKVMSRADYVLSQSKAQAKRDSESKMNIEVTAVEVNIEQNLVQDMVVEEAEPALLENRSNRSYVTDNTYNIGSEDESFVDNDFPGAVPSRDEDGAEADAEDEEEEDEDEEDEEDKAIVPYDQVAEGDDEHENTAEEEEEEEEEDDNNNVSEEGDNEAAAPEVVDDEYEEEGGEEVHYEDEDENEAAAMSDDQSSEDAEQGGPNTSNPAYNRQQGAQIGVVDLVSSDDDDDNDNDNDNHEEKVEGTDDEDDGCGNDSFLTADTNDPAISKSSFTAKPHTQSHAHLQTIASIDKAVAATVAVAENPASIRSAVNTVLGALKGSLSTKDFHQLQQMMGKLPESSTIPPLPEPSATVNDIQLHRQASTSFSQAVDYSEAALPKNPAGRESRLSGDGRSWTSRESFLPPSPHDRFAPSVPSAGLSAAPTQSAESQKAMADVSLNYRGVSSVRFEDSERKISLGATNNHIRYGPVTFMRRPMTPFAKKPVSSPSPFTNPLYETSSAMPTQTQGSAVRQQLLTANLPFPSSEEQLRKRRYEDSNSTR